MHVFYDKSTIYITPKASTLSKLRYIIFLFFFFAFSITKAQDNGFKITLIPDTVFEKMQGKSYPKGCPIKRSDLRYLTVLHVDEKGETKHGELVCNKAIAQTLIDIFRELYKQKYPIHSIRLVDEFNGNDELSMEANNTSCFNYRQTSTGGMSKHSKGMAVDVNPLWNPCIHISGKAAGTIEPKTAKRTHIIDRNDPCYKLFKKHGLRWGGAWKTLKDYQHFDK